MNRLYFLTPSIAVSGSLREADFPCLASRGFRSVLNNRPDDEEACQTAASFDRTLAERAGLAYRHVPAAKHAVLDDEVVAEAAHALEDLPKPILMYCRTGQRSAILWAAASLRKGSALDNVLDAARIAGFDLSAIAEEIARHTSNRGSGA